MRLSVEDVLSKAAQVETLVPDALVVGGPRSTMQAESRASFGEDDVLTNLAERFDTILRHPETLGDWSAARAQPGKIILVEHGGSETDLLQLLRRRPLETAEIVIRGGRPRVPTDAEMLRIKAWLALNRNQTRDYVDVATLAAHIGLDEAAALLADIDDYYADIGGQPEAVATQLARQLADPRPRDVEVTAQLASCTEMQQRWQSWTEVKAVLANLAERMLG
ncbi:MAG: hypothetical protein ACYCUM_08940 [Solirubrobacteraceae bacterium]